MFKGVENVVLMVKDLDASIAHFESLLGVGPTPIGDNAALGYRQTFFRMPEGDLELVSPTGEGGPIAKRLSASGEGVYMITLKVDDLAKTLDDLRAKGVRLVGDPGAGNPVTGQVFIHPSAMGGVLAQLVES